jgi:hypothetical protein
MHPQELSSLICSLIDGFYLFKTNSTFSENFYSLTRTVKSNKLSVLYLILHYLIPCLFRSPFLSKLYDLAKGASMASFLYLNFSFFSPEYWLLQQKLIRQEKRVSLSYWFLGFIGLLKLAQIFYTSPNKKSSSSKQVLDIKPPYQTSEVPLKTCGICREPWVNPTALTSSGYVFCYTCIRNHLGMFSVCPVTSIRSSLKNMRRVHL